MLTTLRSGYYLGIDCGASKTEVVISDESGFVLARAIGKGGNPHNMSLEEAVHNVWDVIAAAKQQSAEKHPDRTWQAFETSVIGWAGIDTPEDIDAVCSYMHVQEGERKSFGARKLLLVNNGLVSMQSGTSQQWGICLVSGTGSLCYGVSQIGKEAAAGHWGYILGDQASAYAIGQKILRQVMKEHDGRSFKTPLTRKVLSHLQLDSISQLVAWTYGDYSLPVSEVAGLSRLIDDVGLSDLVTISSIVDESALELFEAYRAIVDRLGFAKYKEGFPVVLNGGMFASKGMFSQKIIRLILSLTPQANVVFPTKSPAEGAIRIAQLGSALSVLPESIRVFVNPHI